MTELYDRNLFSCSLLFQACTCHFFIHLYCQIGKSALCTFPNHYSKKMDITRQSMLNPLEIKIDDDVSIFVDPISMAHHSKLFYNLKTAKDDDTIPKIRGCLDHWKLIHRHCVNRTWERVLVKEISNLADFFTLLEFIQIDNTIVDLLLRDALDANLITDKTKFPNGIVEDCQSMKSLGMVILDTSIELYNRDVETIYPTLYRTTFVSKSNLVCNINITQCKNDPQQYVQLIGREIIRQIKRLRTDK